MKKTKSIFFIAAVVSLGGFLFGFDAGIISGVMEYAGPQFNLNDTQWGWVVSSPSLAAMFAMLFSGGLSDIIGRKPLLISIALMYSISAVLSAMSGSYEMLFLTRMLGGIAFGAALVLAPTYIAEIANAENRGKLVSIQQLNIVLGFFAAFLCNYYLNKTFTSGDSWMTDDTVWRWMLGVEAIPALLYFILMFFVPKSPRWLFSKGRDAEATNVLTELHGSQYAQKEAVAIKETLLDANQSDRIPISDLFSKGLRFIVFVGLAIGILQQVTGINAIYFYATSIFKQTGIGTNAAFTSGMLMSGTTVVFTLIAMYLIDRVGRRPLLIVGIGGIAASLLLCAYAFSEATYTLDENALSEIPVFENINITTIQDKVFDSDVTFKNELKSLLGNQMFIENEGAILEQATTMNATMALIGILGFIACFAFSLGPVMWVMLSELYPNKYRGLAIGVIGFVNSFASWVVQQIFPWELSNLGAATTFLIFGLLGLFGFFLFLKILPETKGKSLEQLEKELVRS